MNKIKLITTIIMSTLLLSCASGAKKMNEGKDLKVIFFDVNETMLDLDSMRASVGKALNGRKELLSYWFSKCFITL